MANHNCGQTWVHLGEAGGGTDPEPESDPDLIYTFTPLNSSNYTITLSRAGCTGLMDYEFRRSDTMAVLASGTTASNTSNLSQTLSGAQGEVILRMRPHAGSENTFWCWNIFNGSSNPLTAGASLLTKVSGTLPIPPTATSGLGADYYAHAYNGCSNLVEFRAVIPPIHEYAATLGNCFLNMFLSCMALKSFSAFPTFPNLSKGASYANFLYGMFHGCSSLESVPALPHLSSGAFSNSSLMSGMFKNCYALRNVETFFSNFDNGSDIKGTDVFALGNDYGGGLVCANRETLKQKYLALNTDAKIDTAAGAVTGILANQKGLFGAFAPTEANPITRVTAQTCTTADWSYITSLVAYNIKPLPHLSRNVYLYLTNNTKYLNVQFTGFAGEELLGVWADATYRAAISNGFITAEEASQQSWEYCNEIDVMNVGDGIFRFSRQFTSDELINAYYYNIIIRCEFDGAETEFSAVLSALPV